MYWSKYSDTNHISLRSTLNSVASLPVFLLILAAICILLRVAGFVFVSQISNFFAIVIIVALTVKDWRCGKNTLYILSPITALIYISATLAATETSTFSFTLMVVMVLACSLIVFFHHSEKKYRIVLGIAYGGVFLLVLLLRF